MTKQRLMTVIAAVLTTLLESGGWCPASSIYMALGMDIHEYQSIAAIMTSADLVTVTSETVTLTDKGRDLAEQCNQDLAASK